MSAVLSRRGPSTMTVDAVVAEVELAADEPFCPGQIPLEHLVPGLEPVQFLRGLGPEFLRIFDRLLVHGLVLLQALDVRLRAELLRAAERRGFRAAWNPGRDWRAKTQGWKTFGSFFRGRWPRARAFDLSTHLETSVEATLSSRAYGRQVTGFRQRAPSAGQRGRFRTIPAPTRARSRAVCRGFL